MSPRFGGTRPVWAVLVVALICFALLPPVAAVIPLDAADGGARQRPVTVTPEVLESAELPERPADPVMEPKFVTAPTPTRLPAPVPAAAAASSAPAASTPVASTPTAEPPAGALDPAVDGTTRSNFPWGAGTASWYAPGTGVAMHYCSWTYRNSVGCGSVRITSVATGRSVIAPVIDYCQCYWGTRNQRIVDLQTGLLAPLGLSSSAGLYDVVVEPVD